MRFWILGIEVARSLEIDAEEGKYSDRYTLSLALLQ